MENLKLTISMKKIISTLYLIAFAFVALAQVQYGTGELKTNGSITTQNLNPLTGVPTAGSFVRLDLTNQSTLAIDVSGTYTGALSLQYSIDNGTTWQTVSNTLALTLQSSSAKSATITSASVGKWIANISGWESVRISALAAVTGTAVVRLKAVVGSEVVTFDEPLPTGTNVIGALSANQSTNVAQINGVTPLMGSGTNGTGAQRITIATDQAALTVAGVISAKIDQTTVGTTNAFSLAQVGATTVVNGGVAGTLAVGGNVAASAAVTANPLTMGGVVTPTTIGTQDQTFVAGDVGRLPLTTGAQLTIKPYATAEIDWQYAAAASGIVSTTTAVTFKAASGTAGIRTYIISIQVGAIGAGTASELAIRDGAAGTVVWRLQIPAAGWTTPMSFNFPTPIRGTANTLFEVVTLTSTATPVFFNAQGYTGF